MKYTFLFTLLFAASAAAFAQPKVGDNYGGIVKTTSAAAIKNKNGIWDTGDKTGNAAVDTELGNLNTANPNNPAAMSALESTAAYIKTHPELYVTADGKIITVPFTDLIRGKFAGVANANLGKYAKLKRRVLG